MGSKSSKPSVLPKCAICKAPIPSSGSQLAYLEMCYHYFHSDCIIKRRKAKYDRGAYDELVQCPVCRVDSSRVMLWPCVFASEEDKKTTFRLQKECLGLNNLEPESSVLVKRMADGQHLVVIDGQDYLLGRSKDGAAQQKI